MLLFFNVNEKLGLDSIKKLCTHKKEKSNNRALNLLKNQIQKTSHGKYNTCHNGSKSRDFNDNWIKEPTKFLWKK
jgi:hypothetical protein